MCSQAAVVGKSYQKHFLALKCGRGTLPSGLQRIKKTLLACGVPDSACEDPGLLRQVGAFFGFQRHLLDFKSILFNVEKDVDCTDAHCLLSWIKLAAGKPDATSYRAIPFSLQYDMS